ncbi:MAG TPA: pepsin/retropepsin-like aspartic protease family protein [Candidatus Solibacter sp.]|nr:pepsin/retropepsin-like aspartic protease family protein [Candidatus Solibacter sp.]
MMQAAVLRLFRIAGSCALGVVLSAAQSAPRLLTPMYPYKLKLDPYVPSPGRAMGVMLKTRINGGRPLRLILDSGAEHLVISREIAKATGLAPIADLAMIGFGRKSEGSAQIAVAKWVDVGPLAFEDCPVDIMDRRVVAGADGVVPLSLFSDFLVRLDFPGRVLDLMPYSEAGDAPDGFVHVRSIRAALFVETRLNGSHNGYFLLDTGAAHNALSSMAAQELGGPGVNARTRMVQGAGGVSEVQAMNSRVRFGVAKQEIVSDDVVLVNLDNLSRHNGLNVAGLLGYPALRRYVVTVNYRDSLVRMEESAAE